MEDQMAEEPEKQKTVDEVYIELYRKLQAKFKADMELNDGNFMHKCMTLCSDHQYAMTLWVDERHKLELMEEQHDKLLENLIKQVQAKSANISASNKADAVKMAMMDPRFINSRKELAWRKKLTKYLEETCKIFAKRYYLLETAKDIYKMDKSNAPIVNKEKED